MYLIILFLGFVFSVNCVSYNDSFNEELLIKPLASGHIYSYFQFTTTWYQKKYNCKLLNIIYI